MRKIEPEAGSLHGSFSRDYAPIMTITPGETVTYRTLDARWGLEPPHSPYQFGKQFEPRRDEDDGHALCGPLAIRGAEPGMMLSIKIEQLMPGYWGWTLPWFPMLGGDGEKAPFQIWTLDRNRMTGTNQHGHTVALRPFMGVMGMPPAEPGIHSTTPPRLMGGNLDCKALVEGSTLYLPVSVPGALFSVGDGHAAQGDGEVGGCAIECPMDEVVLTFDLHNDTPLNTPYAYTPEGWVTFGFGDDLDTASLNAMNAMLDFMVQHLKIERWDALSLAGVIVDLRVTQIVNSTCGAHAVLPHDALIPD